MSEINEFGQLPAPEGQIEEPKVLDQTENWITQIATDFTQWASNREMPKHSTEDEPDEIPDLYSFYESLCTLKNDVRTSTRKNHETLGRFNESLDLFGRNLSTIETSLRELHIDGKSNTPRELLVPLADMADRLRRIKAAVGNQPGKTFFVSQSSWKSYADTLASAFSILDNQFCVLLSKLGIEPIITLGSDFDPRTMVAVAVESAGSGPDGRVIEEIAAGYLYNGTVLKLAEVKVTKSKEII